jgi:hypothetical protein
MRERSSRLFGLLASSVFAMCVVGAAHAKHYALIVSGLGGEAEYEQRFQAQAKALATATEHASRDTQVTTLVGPKATRDAIHTVLLDWTKQVTADDQFVMTLIGHGSFDGEEYRFNIPGPDITATDLHDWLQPLKARQQLLVIATSASGGALAHLQGDQRVVITATKSGGERNATRFADFWIQALSANEADRDKNEWVTAQEAFDFAVRKVADVFKANASLATEHARLEGKHAESLPLGRLGNAPEMPSDAKLVNLFAERLRVETEFDAVRAQKEKLPTDAYYAELEKKLVVLAKTQRLIDARQAALSKEKSP